MRYARTQPRPLRDPEVVLNLWAYADAAGLIMRLAGKAYVMDGSEEANLALLHQLAATDFLAAGWEKVPAHCSITNAYGEQLHGAAHASMLADLHSHSVLFGPLIERLAGELPGQLRCVDGEYQKFGLELPASPLTVTTLVLEHDDGRLEPMMSAE